MFGLKKQGGLVGLDVGSSSVKAVELGRRGGKYELLSMAVEDFPPGAVVNQSIADAISVAMAIGKVFAENNIRTSQVATAVSGHSVIVKKITVAGDTADEVAEAIGEEAERAIQLDLGEVTWDYQVLGAAPGRNLFDVMLVAVKREKVLSHTEVIRQAGKQPVVVDIDAFALQNAFEMSYEPSPHQVNALLDVGSNITNINIVRNGVPLFTRDISAGADRLAESAGAAGTEGEAAVQLRASLEPLVHEIQKTFDFYRETNSAASIERIYLAGGPAGTPGLAAALAEELQLPVEVMDPLRKLELKGSRWDAEQVHRLAPRMGVAMGLALRGFD
ncbi:MAG TPA: type IV pilus assembly protein PilM [Terriglobia bacterium]|nr:type IV pilus assembly protein PilM [Terriglobia bacterium]